MEESELSEARQDLAELKKEYKGIRTDLPDIRLKLKFFF